MSKISITPSATGTGVFTIASPATNTDRTLTLPDEAGTVLTSASSIPTSVLTGNIIQNAGPAFSATLTSDQTVSNNTWTKLNFITEVFDTNGNYDSSRFTPTIAGYYQINLTLWFGGVTSLTRGQAAIYKTGVISTRIVDTATKYGFSGSDLIYCNGSTDYVEAYVYITGSGLLIEGSVSVHKFSGSLVRAA